MLGLMCLPVIWNGLSLIHYVVEHTHVFCKSDTNHEHTSAQDCSSFCLLSKDQEHKQLLTQIEFFELKQCISPLSDYHIQPFSSDLSSVDKRSSLFHGRIYSNDVFQPPIC